MNRCQLSTRSTPAIVLVDDEPGVLTVLHRLVCNLAPGYQVIAVRDGATALAKIRQRPVVLVLTDYLMPDMDGVTLTAAIKAVAPECRVVLTTAHATPEIWQRAEAAGATSLLLKPFPYHQLQVMLQRALTA